MSNCPPLSYHSSLPATVVSATAYPRVPYIIGNNNLIGTEACCILCEEVDCDISLPRFHPATKDSAVSVSTSASPPVAAGPTLNHSGYFDNHTEVNLSAMFVYTALERHPSLPHVTSWVPIVDARAATVADRSLPGTTDVKPPGASVTPGVTTATVSALRSDISWAWLGCHCL